MIFRLEHESVDVYWDTSVLNPPEEDNPTAPFATEGYDATTLLCCKAKGDSAFGNCPVGILRMEDRQASVVIRSQLGKQFTINFLPRLLVLIMINPAFAKIGFELGQLVIVEPEVAVLVGDGIRAPDEQ